MRTLKDRAIVSLLGRDRIRNINLLNFLTDNPVTSLEAVEESVMLRGRSDHDWVLLSSESPEQFRKLTGGLTAADRFFAVVEDWMLPLLTGDRPAAWQFRCIQFYLPDEAVVSRAELDMTPLAATDASYIYSQAKYQTYTSVDYIRERTGRGPGFGIQRDGKLVAWILTHDDGAMGFLHVLEDYRGRGFARQLTLAMVEKMRRMGRLPFVQIEEGNKPSLGLAADLGFVPDRYRSWLELR